MKKDLGTKKMCANLVPKYFAHHKKNYLAKKNIPVEPDSLFPKSESLWLFSVYQNQNPALWMPFGFY